MGKTMKKNLRKLAETATQNEEQVSLSEERLKRKEEACQFLETPSTPSVTTSQTSSDTQLMKEKIIAALKEIYDPEIPVNIYDLGLIYGIEIGDACCVAIQMTLTSPMCPVAQTFPQTVQDAILQVPGVSGVTVDLVWEPPWTKEHMSEVAKLQLNLF